MSVRSVTSEYSQTHIESGGYPVPALFNDKLTLLPVRVAHLGKTRHGHGMYEAQ